MVIKEVIAQTKQDLVVATAKSAQLLGDLTSKATTLERLKAALGLGSSTLSAFVALIDNEIEEDDTALLQVNPPLCFRKISRFRNRNIATSTFSCGWFAFE